MTMEATAAISRKAGEPMTLERVFVEDPRPGEILVRIVGTGICHTDAVLRDQLIPVPQPVVLGHEGAGVVERVGADVTVVAPGDHVVLSFDSCGFCPSCADGAPAYCHELGRYNFGGSRLDGSSPLSNAQGPVHANIFGQSSFATHAIAHERNVVKVDKDLPLHLLGPLGCGIQTGAGAILNALQVRSGRSVAIFGAGAVGLSAVMAARIAGAATIVAVDRNAARLALALDLGATHIVEASDDVGEAIRAACPGGLDYALDTTGIAAVIETAVALLAPRGVCGILGASSPTATLSINETHLMSAGRMIRGIVEGDSVPQRFIPELIGHYRAGRFPFDRLITEFAFEDINRAFEASERGDAIKPVIRMPA